MSTLDWIVLSGTLLLIVAYGVYKNRKHHTLDVYLLGHQNVPWWRIGFSVMATQASAITFLSAPGLAYIDGMRFVQFYFGLPLAMIFISVFFLPIYQKLKVYTAYQFLEQRFDLKTRSLTAMLFLTQRGLAAGLTIYAPSIVLSSLLGWNIYWTNVFMGGLVITYTMTGGTRAVSMTQLQQLLIIFIGMFIAGWMAVKLLPDGIGFTDALMVAGKMGKTNVITTNFDWNDRYNIWSGVIGGFFLALSYFGTDQSQVGRYLTGRSVTQSRLGLLMNGMLKVPMQFLILMIGALVFAFYQFNPSPVFFNDRVVERVLESAKANEFSEISNQYNALTEGKKKNAFALLDGMKNKNTNDVNQAQDELRAADAKGKALRAEAIAVIKEAHPSADTNDTNYIFLTFVLHYLPHGLIGLLIAVVFCASWNSTTAELNALASTSIIDIYKRSIKSDGSDKHYINASKVATLCWGIFAIGVAQLANKLGSLIEAVNILGSLFYGTILGIFLTAFFLKKVKGNAVFLAALITEALVIIFYMNDVVAFLWLNMIGCGLVMIFSLLLNKIFRNQGHNIFP
ncbi:MAG TPA: sodium:solute symporter [Chitinophagales bacterium]|nr:sodium:solute symporter [Chitinophagales bacterium]